MLFRRELFGFLVEETKKLNRQVKPDTNANARNGKVLVVFSEGKARSKAYSL